jgi:hypothetical protein
MTDSLSLGQLRRARGTRRHGTVDGATTGHRTGQRSTGSFFFAGRHKVKANPYLVRCTGSASQGEDGRGTAACRTVCRIVVARWGGEGEWRVR